MLNIIERMIDHPLVFDGAMGTMIYERGVFINTCYDELSLTRAELICRIHRDYIEAGSEAVETNTFGANRLKLAPHGLAGKVKEINQAAVRCARDAAGDSVYVVASVGPCTYASETLSPENTAEVQQAFREQIDALLEAGVDCIMLETFTKLDELVLALQAVADPAVPVIASFTVGSDGATVLGTPATVMVNALDAHERVNAIGLNCGVGPAGAYDTLENVMGLTQKPVLVMPNAGLPREVGGRMLYLSSPEYFTEYSRRFVEMGARAVGGCCGTTPAHIRMMARAVQSMSGVKKHVEVKAYQRTAHDVEIVPVNQKSRFANKLVSGEKATSVELLPPRSIDMSSLLHKARQCSVNGIDAINIPDGPRASTRVSPMIAALAILKEANIEPVLHYCCRDRNLIGMQADILGAYAAGLHNILIITGDPPKLGDYPDATGVFDVDAIGLTQAVANMNHGVDVGGNPVNPPTGVFICVGANPCAVDPEREIERYFKKLDAGAEFAITQPVFDTEALYRFLDKVQKHTKTIPVVAGVWPLTSYRNAEFMNNEVPGVVVPDAILERLKKTTSKEEGAKVGS
ncbi:MAG: bifunctional homocysteine S-methyltransferase/methylenetetrahydrofolate reductase, partial [Chitinivibrionales bacterium]|nr:bifunctional homocysteine S-methyltransferase/methylenetetrahydrofolate reductase [Chitinivibrionales bacterium]MBD3356743.1 bifunctional homocysteine S-methyltransferase/methylenetetrahydrofolate reductase [Chitinivibrionales bacterium]